MTQRTDIEGVLDLWLADGPPHVPDRVFDDAVAAVYRAPQRSTWRLRWRNLTVSTKLLAAAAALVAVAGVGLLIMAGAPTPPPTSTPTPTVAPSATPAPTDTAATVGPTLCPPSEPNCTGPLAAGTHSTSSVVSPVWFTVPDGWSKTLDVPGSMNLEREGQSDAFVAVWPDFQIASQTVCTGQPEPGLGRGVVDLLTFLVNHPGLAVTAPDPTVLGGLPGVVLDVRRDGSWSGPCPDGVNLFTHQGTINDIGRELLEGSWVERLWLLDGPNAHVTSVAVKAPNPDALDAFVEIATPVIESFAFVRGSCIDGTSCVGDLLPGLHRAGPPFAHPLTYVVPDGWANSFNGEFGYVLQSSQHKAAGQPGIHIFTGVSAATRSCSMSEEPGVGKTASDLSTWIGELPGFIQADRQEVSLGGLAGFSFDLTVSADAALCRGEARFLVGDSPGLWWGLTPRLRDHVILLDDGDGGNVAIIVEAPLAEFDAFAEAATRIVDSFDFTP